MTSKQFDKVESKLVDSIVYLSERLATAEEAEALAAVVDSLASLVLVREEVQAAQQAFE